MFSVWRDLMYDLDDTGLAELRSGAALRAGGSPSRAARPGPGLPPTTDRGVRPSWCGTVKRCSVAPASSSSLPLSCRLASCHEPLGPELRLASLEWRSDSERWRLATLSQ